MDESTNTPPAGDAAANETDSTATKSPASVASAPGDPAAGTPTAQQAAEQLKTTLSAADIKVNQQLQTLGQVHQARLSQANRTLAALTAQYGANDPRVKVAQASVAATQSTISKVALVRQQLAVPAVQVASAGWALQGHVLDSGLQPQARFTVFLVDSNKSFLKQYGFAYTDENGYYLLNYAGDTKAAGADTAAGATAAAGASAPQLFVAVVDTGANPVYLGSTAFQPVLGAATYQDIVLAPGGKPLGDPTQAIRAEAFPPKPGA